MANDPDALFPSGPTTRRGLLSAFSRRAAEALPVPDVASCPRVPPTTRFHEEPPDWIEPFLSGEELIAEIQASVDETGMHIWWLGQSGFLVQIDGENLLLDPYLSDSLTEKYAGTETPHERITGLVVDPALLSFVDVVTVEPRARSITSTPARCPHVLAGDAAFVCAAGSEDVAAERAGRLPDVVLGDRRRRDVRRTSGSRPSPPTTRTRPRRSATSSATARTRSTTPATRRRVQGMAEAVAPVRRRRRVRARSTGSTATWTAPTPPGSRTRPRRTIAIPCHHEMFRCDTASTVAVRRRVRADRPGVPAPARRRADHDRLRLLSRLRPHRSARRPAVVEHDRRARERAAAGPEQERRHVGDLVRLDQPLDRLRLEQELRERLVLG